MSMPSVVEIMRLWHAFSWLFQHYENHIGWEQFLEWNERGFDRLAFFLLLSKGSPKPFDNKNLTGVLHCPFLFATCSLFFLHFASQATFYGCPRASGLMCLQRTKVSAALRWVCSQCFLEIDCYLENRSSGGSLSFAPLSIPSESAGKPLSERQFRF